MEVLPVYRELGRDTPLQAQTAAACFAVEASALVTVDKTDQAETVDSPTDKSGVLVEQVDGLDPPLTPANGFSLLRRRMKHVGGVPVPQQAVVAFEVVGAAAGGPFALLGWL